MVQGPSGPTRFPRRLPTPPLAPPPKGGDDGFFGAGERAQQNRDEHSAGADPTFHQPGVTLVPGRLTPPVRDVGGGVRDRRFQGVRSVNGFDLKDGRTGTREKPLPSREGVPGERDRAPGFPFPLQIPYGGFSPSLGVTQHSNGPYYRHDRTAGRAHPALMASDDPQTRIRHPI